MDGKYCIGIFYLFFFALRHRLLHVAEWFEDNDKKGLK